MKMVSDDLILENYRKHVQTYLNMNMYSTALFWADKVVALSNSAPKDVYWLANCMFMLKEYHRAANLLCSKELEKSYVLCNYLVVRCLLEAHEYTEAMRVLSSINVDIFQPYSTPDVDPPQGFFDDSPRYQIQAAMLLLKGRLWEALDNRGLASECYRQALQYDVHCYEAFNALIKHEMLPASEEQELLDSLPLAQQCSEAEVVALRTLYQSKLKKYQAPSETPANKPVLKRLQASLDLTVSHAESLYYDCRYHESHQITQKVLDTDPFHTDCLPLHVACLVHLKLSNSLFSLAHRLVDLYPDLAISWFAVGCYYLVIGKSDPARRYLLKATSLDKLFGPAWLAYGHSFAVENEHDQAMAAYFKASQLMRGCHLPLLYIGLECGLTNNTRLADKFFQQAQKIAPSDPFVMHEMGVICFHNADYKGAEKHFKLALSRVRRDTSTLITDKWEPLFNNLGHTCRKLKKYQEALDYHYEALVLSPQNHNALSAIGYCSALMGSAKEAADWFHKALALKHDDTFSATMLNYVVEQLADEMAPYPGAPEDIPNFSSAQSSIDSSVQGAEPAQSTDTKHDTNIDDMSMSFDM